MRKFILIALISIVLISLACRSETGTQAQNKSGNINSAAPKAEKNVSDKKEPVWDTKSIKNIKQSLKFNDEKPAILSVINSKKINVKAVGLKKGQIMSKHKAPLKSLVIVLEGKIEMTMDGQKKEYAKLDTFEIPANVEHELRGIEQSVFSLIQEK